MLPHSHLFDGPICVRQDTLDDMIDRIPIFVCGHNHRVSNKHMNWGHGGGGTLVFRGGYQPHKHIFEKHPQHVFAEW